MADSAGLPQPDAELKRAYAAALVTQIGILSHLVEMLDTAAPGGDWGDDILRTQASLRMSMLALQRLTTELERQGFGH